MSTIHITPDTTTPIPSDLKPESPKSFREQASAYYHTVKELSDNGMEFLLSDEDKQESHQAVSTETLPPPQVIKPGMIANLEAILSSCDQELMDVSRRLRHYVTNRLLVESTDEDPKVRLKSLELLGKVGEVGLFAEKKDITITTRTQADINTELEKTLELYLGKKPFEVPLEAEFTPVHEELLEEELLPEQDEVDDESDD